MSITHVSDVYQVHFDSLKGPCRGSHSVKLQSVQRIWYHTKLLVLCDRGATERNAHEYMYFFQTNRSSIRPLRSFKKLNDSPHDNSNIAVIPALRFEHFRIKRFPKSLLELPSHRQLAFLAASSDNDVRSIIFMYLSSFSRGMGSSHNPLHDNATRIICITTSNVCRSSATWVWFPPFPHPISPPLLHPFHHGLLPPHGQLGL